MGTPEDVAAHDQAVTRRYIIHYPAHPARENDPHYVDFHAFHEAQRQTARCSFGELVNDYSECADAKGVPAPPPPSGAQPGLELHHGVLEFSLQNGVDLARLEHVYPGISDPLEVGAWVESGTNFEWLCAKHHRSHGGVHVAASADYEASHFVKGLIT